MAQGEVRQRLLDAAIDHVTTNGLGDLSLRALAGELGTSHRMLSHHFGSKDGLWVEIVREVERRQLDSMRALVHDPRIIIADEPTGNLDPVISWEIIQLLLRINELGVTVLMATHNAEVVTALRKRVVALEDGRVIRDETGAAYHRED